MTKLSKHPNLVQLYGIARDPEKPTEVSMVMQLVPFGSLLRVMHSGKLEWTHTDRVTAALQVRT